MNHDYKLILSARIKEHVESNFRIQNDAAILVGMSRSHFNDMIKGRVTGIGAKKFAKACEVFGLEYKDVLPC
ncbi:hypothetical protein PYR66_10000 [Klebsiella aerogenes]|nr:hypothetical protein PYR66_10000 [Klebsiella aerogenes]